MINELIIENLKKTIAAYKSLSDKQEEIIKKQQSIMEQQAEIIVSLKREIQSLYNFPISI